MSEAGPRWLSDEDLAKVRSRPGMYLGPTDHRAVTAAVLSLLGELADDLRGPARRSVEVAITRGPRVVIAMDGQLPPPQTIRAAPPAVTDETLIELYATEFHRPDAHRLFSLTIMNVFGASLEVEATAGGTRYQQAFSRGRTLGPAVALGPAEAPGVRVVWEPDGAIIQGWEQVSATSLMGALRRHAALAPGGTCEVRDERTGAVGRTCYPGGLADFLCDQTGNELHGSGTPPISVAGERDGVRVAVALQLQPWAERPGWFESFANGAPTEYGGSHARAFWRGLQDALADLAAAEGIAPPRLPKRTLERAFHGAVAVWLERPYYDNSMKASIRDPRAGDAVRALLRRELPAQIRASAPDILPWLANLASTQKDNEG